MSANPASGSNFNRYWYANNNPYRYIDPDGRCTGSRIANSDGTCQSGGGNTLNAATPGTGKNFAYYKRLETQRTESEREAISESATLEANEALAGTIGKPFKTVSAAARHWASKINPIASRYLTEIASRLFKVKGGVAYGAAVSTGHVLSVEVSFSPRFRGAQYQVGYIHTHPTSQTLGAADLTTALEMRNNLIESGGEHQTAFVVLDNGSIDYWSTEFYDSTPSDGTSWAPHFDQIRRLEE